VWTGWSPNWNYAFKIVMPWGVLLGHVGEIKGDCQGEEDRGRGPLRDADLKHLSAAETQDACAGCNIGIYSRVLEPKVVTIMGAAVTGGMSRGIWNPKSTAAWIWERIGSCGPNNCGPWSVAM